MQIDHIQATEYAPDLASPLHKPEERERLDKLAAQARKASADAAALKSALLARENSWTDLCNTLKEMDARVELGKQQVAWAEEDYARSVASLDGLAGNPDGPQTLWREARRIAPERDGLELLKAAVGKLPALRAAALEAVRKFAASNGVPDNLIPE